MPGVVGPASIIKGVLLRQRILVISGGHARATLFSRRPSFTCSSHLLAQLPIRNKSFSVIRHCPASSPCESHRSAGFIRVNHSAVTYAYHHSLTVRRVSLGWLLLGLPPNDFGASMLTHRRIGRIPKRCLFVKPPSVSRSLHCVKQHGQWRVRHAARGASPLDGQGSTFPARSDTSFLRCCPDG